VLVKTRRAVVRPPATTGGRVYPFREPTCFIQHHPVYITKIDTHLNCNRRAIHEYPNLWNYTKELYGLPGVAETVNMEHVTRHYYRSHTDLNPKRLVPTGPAIDFTEPHDRDRLPGGPPAVLEEGADAGTDPPAAD